MVINRLIKEKGGWIRILEAFFAALLVIVIVVIIVNNQTPQKTDSSNQIYNSEIYVLRVIELNDSLRQEILNLDNSTFPLSWGNATFPPDLKTVIEQRSPSYLSCDAQICNVKSICNHWNNTQQELYAQKILITSTVQTYSPRQLKLFCWMKQQ